MATQKAERRTAIVNYWVFLETCCTENSTIYHLLTSDPCESPLGPGHQSGDTSYLLVKGKEMLPSPQKA